MSYGPVLLPNPAVAKQIQAQLLDFYMRGYDIQFGKYMCLSTRRKFLDNFSMNTAGNGCN